MKAYIQSIVLMGLGIYLFLKSKETRAGIHRNINNLIIDPYDPYRNSYWTTPAHGVEWDFTTNQAEEKYGLPTGILSAMARRESQYDPNAIGQSGEQGMMQIIPKWHPGISDPFQPVPAIFYAGKILRQYYNEFEDWDMALAAYNWGETNVRNYGLGVRMPTSTGAYIDAILSDVGLA